MASTTTPRGPVDGQHPCCRPRPCGVWGSFDSGRRYGHDDDDDLEQFIDSWDPGNGIARVLHVHARTRRHELSRPRREWRDRQGRSRQCSRGGQHVDIHAAQNDCSHLIPAGEGLGGQNAKPVTTEDQHYYLRAVACMRSHGFPTFPDPIFSGGSVSLPPTPSINTQSPQYAQAQGSVSS